MSETTKLFGRQYSTVTTVREIKPSKKALEKDPAVQSKKYYASRPVFESTAEFIQFLSDAANEADARQPGNGMLWLDRTYRAKFEDATEASLRGDGTETDDAEWQTEFINIETGGRSLSALEKTVEDLSKALLELALMHTTGAWKTEVNAEGALVFEDEAHYMTVLHSRNAAYTRAQQIFRAAADHAAVKAAADKEKKAAKAAAAKAATV